MQDVPKRRRLTRLTVKSISLVGLGANQAATVALYKSAGPPSASSSTSRTNAVIAEAKALIARIEQARLAARVALRKAAADRYEELIAKAMERDALTRAEAAVEVLFADPSLYEAMTGYESN